MARDVSGAETSPGTSSLNPSALSNMLDAGGEKRLDAIRFVTDGPHYELLNKLVSLLVETDSSEEQRAILKALISLKVPLENYVPNWDLYVDQYIQPERSDDLLIIASRLVLLKKEHRLMPAMIRICRHQSVAVRLVAFQAMASMGNDRLIPALLSLFASDLAMDRVYALEGAFYYHDNRIQPFVFKALSDENKSVRIHAIVALSSEPSMAAAIANRYYQDDDGEVRGNIVRTIVDSGWRQYSSIVYRAITDDDAKVRWEAMEGVQRWRDRNALSFISRALRKECEPELQRIALQTFLLLGGDGGGEGVNYLMENDPDPSIRQMAAMTAGYLKSRASLRSLVSVVLEDPDSDVRAEAADALGRISDPYAIGYLDRVIANGRELEEVRSAALAALLNIKSGDSVLRLTALLDRAPRGALQSQLERIVGRKGQ